MREMHRSVPGGSIADPQSIADEMRRIAEGVGVDVDADQADQYRGFEPGSFGCHEALDRASIVLEMAEYLASHPAVAIRPDFKRYADAAAEALAALYSAIGDEHLKDCDMPAVRFKRLPLGEGLPLPCYANPGDSGMDLCAAESCVVTAGGRLRVPTGFAAEIPAGYEGQIRPRSGIAASHGVTVLNTPGTIDSAFRGMIEVLLINTGIDKAFYITRGDRIAQLVIAPVVRAEVMEVGSLSETERGDGGFGSTGQA